MKILNRRGMTVCKLIGGETMITHHSDRQSVTFTLRSWEADSLLDMLLAFKEQEEQLDEAKLR